MRMKKVFILDTNVLLSNPLSLFKFDEHDVVIPISVIEEIDTFKKDQSNIGRNAREVSRILDKLRSRGTLSSGIPIFTDRDDSGQLFVYLGQNMDLLPELLISNADNHILAIALTLQKQFGKTRKVFIITKDSNLRIKADAFGLEAQDFEADKVSTDHMYEGIHKIAATPEIMNEFYSKREVRVALDRKFPHQYVVFEDAQNPTMEAYGIYDMDDDIVRMFEPRNDGVWGIFPRNFEQACALDALLNDKIQLVTLSGAAGTGKTLLAIAAGLSKTTDEDQYQKLLVSRPIFPLGRDIGFLPGDLDEKLNPWMQPIYDNLELLLGGAGKTKQKKMVSRGYQELITQGMLAVEPLTYIRGRSIPNQYFIVDEAQNLNPHEIKTILTRAGENTKIILTGDPYQIDNPYVDTQSNGLTYVIERFKSDKLAAHVTLKKGERSALATRAAELL